MEVKDTALNLVSLRLPARVNDGCKFCKAVAGKNETPANSQPCECRTSCACNGVGREKMKELAKAVVNLVGCHFVFVSVLYALSGCQKRKKNKVLHLYQI